MSFSNKQYAVHALGVVQLLKWLSVWEKRPGAFSIRDGQARLGQQMSQRFAIGIAKRSIFGKHPFLAVQNTEAEWMKAIPWDRAEIRLGSRYLYLVSRRSGGDGEEIPDIPPQVVGIEFDTEEKLRTLAQAKFLEARGVWLDEEGFPQTENGPVWWKLPLVVKPDIEEVLSEEEKKRGYSYEDIVNRQIAEAGVWAKEKGKERRVAAPEFSGDAAELPDDVRSALLGKTDFKNLEGKVR